MTGGRVGWLLVATAWSLLVVATVVVQVGAWDVPAALRALTAVTFAAVVPGLGWARLVARALPGATVALTLALSLSLTLLVAFTMAVMARWSPSAGLAILVAIGAFGLVASLAGGRRTVDEVG